MLVDAIVDPIRRHHADGEEQLKHTSQLAANLLRRHLGGVNRDHHGRHADAHTGDDTRGVESADGPRGRDLDDSPDSEDGGSQDQGATTAEAGSEWPDKETREEGWPLAACDMTYHEVSDLPPACSKLVALELT